MKRREFLTASAGAAAATAAASGSAAASESGGGSGGKTLPDFGGYLDGAKGGEVVDKRGQSEVTIEVGAGSSGLAFAPAGVWIDPGTKVTFEWVSNGHNVIPQSIPDGASWEGYETLEDSGFTYSHTFETSGVYKYFCRPHKSLGMLGAVAVGDDVPTKTVSTGGGGGGGEVNPEHMGVPFQAHWVGVATILGIVVTLLFTFFFLKYGTTPHTGYPEDR